MTKKDTSSYDELSPVKSLQMARDNPQLFIDGCVTDAASLSYALETVGMAHAPANISKENKKVCIQVIFPFLFHENPVVREGAVLGLSHNLDFKFSVADILRMVKKHDTSPGVAAAIDDVLLLED
jgi:hypothetical protein